jgi:hypothetical protein
MPVNPPATLAAATAGTAQTADAAAMVGRTVVAAVVEEGSSAMRPEGPDGN